VVHHVIDGGLVARLHPELAFAHQAAAELARVARIDVVAGPGVAPGGFEREIDPGVSLSADLLPLWRVSVPRPSA
jgi:hypothetical protein